ncbi:MAG TPA: archaetidylserine decarboxylase [Burkholderiaceae bacterium]|nr:archaetidylserine decarboxylase [Burkholderiaceae bacterium]
MNPRILTQRLVQIEALNFVLTNRIPRAALTRLMGWYSHIESPLLTRLSIAVWRLFSDLDLRDARVQRFRSLHACFTRELQPGARPIDGDARVLTSPCDAIVGACGQLAGLRAWQAKGFDYSLAQLFGSDAAAAPWRDGSYATLRLTSAMYHRFHAPHDARIEHITYISGDAWNVNPAALQRVPRLFCLNERAALRLRLSRGGHLVALVPVAAILVASVRLHRPDLRFHLRYRGPNEIACDVPLAKGDEIGWFEHGSTIIVFAPAGFALARGIEPGRRIRMGEPLMTLPSS